METEKRAGKRDSLDLIESSPGNVGIMMGGGRGGDGDAAGDSRKVDHLSETASGSWTMG